MRERSQCGFYDPHWDGMALVTRRRLDRLDLILALALTASRIVRIVHAHTTKDRKHLGHTNVILPTVER